MRQLIIWLLPALAIWISGYLGSSSEENSFDKNKSRRLKSPSFFYLLCGKPKNLKFPERVMAVNGFWRQIFGIMFLLYGFFFDRYVSLLSNQFIGLAIGFLGTFALSGILAYTLYKLNPYLG
jgi:hypothetical protein